MNPRHKIVEHGHVTHRLPTLVATRRLQAVRNGSTHSGRPCSFVVADDHEIVRSSLVQSLQGSPGVAYGVVAQAASVEEAIAAVKQHKPNALILGFSVSAGSGQEVIVEAHRWSPATRIIVFTAATTPGRLANLIALGVHGLYSKRCTAQKLVEHLPALLQGKRFVEPELEALVDQARRSALSNREHQVLMLLVQGNSNREIAGLLGISPKTVEKHRANLMAKLGVHSLLQLVAYALQEGLIDCDAILPRASDNPALHGGRPAR